MSNDREQNLVRHYESALWPTTGWTLIRDAQAAQGEDRTRLVFELLRRYRRPLTAYFQTKRVSQDRIDDLVQGFLLKFVEQQAINNVNKHKGRFRDLLREAARNYRVDQLRFEHAEKRGGGKRFQSLDKVEILGRKPLDGTRESTPAEAYMNGWRRGLLERAQEAVVATCIRQDRVIDFLVFRDYYLYFANEPPTWQEIAARHQVTALGKSDAAKVAARKADWVKRQFLRAIRDEVRFDLGSGSGSEPESERVTDDDIDDDLRDLLQ